MSNKLMRLMGAIPVNRKQDAAPESTVSNDELFASSYEELDKGNIILLFPEGTSVHAPRMFALKKGVGWLVQGYYKKTGKIIKVVPAALNYMRKEKFRSGVLVDFGAPLNLVNDEQDLKAIESQNVPADKRDSAIVHAATDRLEKVFDSLLIQADDFRTLKLLNVARSIYSSGHQLKLDEVVRLQHRFADYYRAHASEPEVQMLVERVGKFSDAVDELGLKEYHFDETMRVPVIMRLVVERLIKMCLIIPFALVGAILGSPLYLFTRKITAQETYIEMKSTNKLYVIFAAMILIGLIVSIASFVFYGLIGMLIGMGCLAMFTWAHLILMEEGVHAWRTTISLLHLLSKMVVSRKHVADLQAERAFIKAAIKTRASSAGFKDRIIRNPSLRTAAVVETDVDRYI